MLIIISTGYYNKHFSNARSTFFVNLFVSLTFISLLASKSPQGGGEAKGGTKWAYYVAVRGTPRVRRRLLQIRPSLQ